MNIPKEIAGQPWSDILWTDVQHYARYIDSYVKIPEKPLFMDIGGNIGAAALLFHYRYHAQVISIEAIRETYTSLERNCRDLPSITTIHSAVGATQETISLFRYPLAPGLGGLDSSRTHIWAVLCREAWANISTTSIIDLLLFPLRCMGWLLWACFAALIVITRKEQTVAQRSISDILEEQSIDTSIDLLKIDIEGHEWNALQGIKDHHWKQIHALIVEVHPQHKENILAVCAKHELEICAQEKALVKGENVPEVIIARKKNRAL